MSSPNPAQLEMRILANHGADKRFAFLRGRWSRAWKIAKGRIRLEQEEEKRRSEEAKQKKVGLGGLSGYGDSDGSEGESEPQEPPNEQPANEVSRDEGVVRACCLLMPYCPATTGTVVG